MADSTPANGQVTDAVTQAGVIALGSAPAHGLAMQYQTGAHATALAMQNATANQQQSATLLATVATQAAGQILTLGPSLSARATVETLSGHALVGELISLSAALQAKRRRDPLPKPPDPANGGTSVSDQEVLQTIRKAADHLRNAADELSKLSATGNGIGKTLEDLHEQLEGAARKLENPGTPGPAPPTPTLPVGATQPGVFIVGSGNTHQPPRIVGASY